MWQRSTWVSRLVIVLVAPVLSAGLASAQPVYFEPISRTESPLPEAISVPFDGDPTPLLVDFDGDGDLELIGTESDNILFVFYRSGEGFERGVRLGAVDSKPALIDVDMDGDLDVVGAHSFTATGLYYEQTSYGQFDARSGPQNPFSTWNIPFRATATPFDVNGDDLEDLVIVDVDVASFPVQQTMHYAERLPDGGFDLRPQDENPFADITCQRVCTRLAFGDVDGDGDYDVVVGYNDSDHNQQRGGLQYFEQTDDTQFEERIGTANPFSSFQFDDQVEPGLADIDEDGDVDVVVGLWGHYVLLENQKGVFTRRTEPYSLFEGVSFRDGQGNPISHTFGDIDGDGDRDLVVSRQLGSFSVLDRTSSQAEPFRKISDPISPLHGIQAPNNAIPALVDLDQDGDLDLVVGWSGGNFEYYEQVDDVTFEKRSGFENPLDGFDVGRDSAPAFGDVDGDGDVDLVAGNRDGEFHFFERVPSGSFEPRTGIANPFDSLSVQWCGIATVVNVPALVDLDRDGDLDLVSGRCFFLNTATGFAPLFSSNPFLSLPNRHFNVVAFDDLDGDNDLDLVELMTGSLEGFQTYMNTGRVFTSIDENPDVGSLSVLGPMPNPASVLTSVILTSEKSQVVRASLFDALSREIQVLHDGPIGQGTQLNLPVRTGDLSAGVYFVRIRGANLDVVKSVAVTH